MSVSNSTVQWLSNFFFSFWFKKNTKYCYIYILSRLFFVYIIIIDPVSWFVGGGRLAIVICVLFGYPLQIHPCRGSVDKILLRFSSNKDAKNSPYSDPPSTIKHVAMTTTLLIGTYVIAITVSQLDLVSLLWKKKSKEWRRESEKEKNISLLK